MTAAIAENRNPGIKSFRVKRAVGTPGMDTISEWNQLGDSSLRSALDDSDTPALRFIPFVPTAL